MCIFVTCVGNQSRPTPSLDLRRSRRLATTAVAHLLKPANSHGRAIMNSWLVPAQTGVSAVNLRKPTSTPQCRQRLSRAPDPPAGLNSACAGRGCLWCTVRILHVCVRCTASTLSPVDFPLPENHFSNVAPELLLAFRSLEDSKLQFSLHPRGQQTTIFAYTHGCKRKLWFAVLERTH